MIVFFLILLLGQIGVLRPGCITDWQKMVIEITLYCELLIEICLLFLGRRCVNLKRKIRMLLARQFICHRYRTKTEYTRECWECPWSDRCFTSENKENGNE